MSSFLFPLCVALDSIIHQTATNTIILGCGNSIIPNSVTSIGAYAFESSAPNNVVASENVLDIGEYAFGWSLDNLVILNRNCDIYDSPTAIYDTSATIYGYENSTAHQYAQKYNRSFVSLDENPILSFDTNMQYEMGSESGATIHCVYPLESFIDVSLNGKCVDEVNYTLQSGSTILTFKPAYLDTLAAGQYEVVLRFAENTITVSLVVSGGSEPVDPDPSNPDDSDEPSDVALGDVDGNGTVNAADAVMVLRSDAGLTTLTAEQTSAADINGDGAVNASDAVQILRFDAGLITQL